jgi:hypothetical protein
MPSLPPTLTPQTPQIVWDTTPFNDLEWPSDGSQPFVLSTGDATGYGQHGDYVFGWKGDSLQRAMDGGCFGASCTGLKTQTVSEANKCGVPERVNEDVDGCKCSLVPCLASSLRCCILQWVLGLESRLWVELGVPVSDAD